MQRLACLFDINKEPSLFISIICMSRLLQRSSSLKPFYKSSMINSTMLHIKQPCGGIPRHRRGRPVHIAGNGRAGVGRIRRRKPHMHRRKVGTALLRGRCQGSSAVLRHSKGLHIPYPTECISPSCAGALPGGRSWRNSGRPKRNANRHRYSFGIVGSCFA